MNSEITEPYVMPEAVKARIVKWKQHFRLLKERQPKQANRNTPEYREAMALLAKDMGYRTTIATLKIFSTWRGLSATSYMGNQTAATKQ